MAKRTICSLPADLGFGRADELTVIHSPKFIQFSTGSKAVAVGQVSATSASGNHIDGHPVIMGYSVLPLALSRPPNRVP